MPARTDKVIAIPMRVFNLTNPPVVVVSETKYTVLWLDWWRIPREGLCDVRPDKRGYSSQRDHLFGR